MDLRELKDTWREFDFRPDKALGQNFLIDKNIKDKIVKALTLTGSETVIEIGAGFGVMTMALAERCLRLVAVEKDPRVLRIMEPFFARKGNILAMHADFLDVDIGSIAGEGGKVTVFGNVPYYISTPIMEKVIIQRERVESLCVMIQEELADRIVSPPGSREYGSISCFVQFYTKPRKLFKISKNSFYPRPKVDSCLLRLDILDSPSASVLNEKLMFDVIHKAFSQRRKKVINPLSDGSLGPSGRQEWEKILSGCGVDPASRAEKLSLDDYAAIADALTG